MLAAQPTLEYGVAKDLFVAYAPNPANLILLTSRGRKGTIASRLRKLKKRTPLHDVELEVTVRLPLLLLLWRRRRQRWW